MVWDRKQNVGGRGAGVGERGTEILLLLKGIYFFDIFRFSLTYQRRKLCSDFIVVGFD